MKNVCLIILLLYNLCTIHAQERLIFAEIPTTQFLQPLIREIYTPLGYEIEFQEFPPERARHLLQYGLVDGYSVAYEVILEMTENIIIVPEFLYKDAIVAYINKDREISVNGWESISSYLVGIVRGHKLIENHTKTFKYRHITDEPGQLFLMLKMDRIDIALFYPLFFCRILAEYCGEFSIAGDPLIYLPVFTFLHEKNAHLVPLVAERIKEMKENGSMDTILAQFTNQ